MGLSRAIALTLRRKRVLLTAAITIIFSTVHLIVTSQTTSTSHINNFPLAADSLSHYTPLNCTPAHDSLYTEASLFVPLQIRGKAVSDYIEKVQASIAGELSHIQYFFAKIVDPISSINESLQKNLITARATSHQILV